MVQKGKAFELAVHQFAKALNPSASVTFNHFVPDRDTGAPRQCDVWIETTIGGHWPLTINVSCKDIGRKLGTPDIDNFVQETAARRATMGVIYSRRGFNVRAITKAKAHNVACCRLYENQPADMPEVVLFPSFLGYVRVGLRIDTLDSSAIDHAGAHTALQKLGSNESSLAELVQKFSAAENEAIEPFNRAREAPLGFATTHELPEPPGKFTLKASGIWRFFRGQLQSHLVNGSYNMTSNAFIGECTTPAIDTWGPNPGDGWIPIEPSEVDFRKGLLLLFLAGKSLANNIKTYSHTEPRSESARVVVQTTAP